MKTRQRKCIVVEVIEIQIAKAILYMIAMLVLISGCAHTPPVEDIHLSIKTKDKETRAKVEAILNDIDERKKTIKGSQEWLAELYASLNIKRLGDIPKEEYKNYKRFLDKDRIYIIVHPAYYVFFQNEKRLSSPDDAKILPSENIVERFYKKISFFDRNMRIFQQQEMILKSFLEFMSKIKKLIVLVLPGDYRNHLSYGYIEGLDEYTRYINEITNGSDSVLYIESISYNQGNIDNEITENLLLLMNEVGAKNIMLGGGYVGRCLEDFYIDLVPKFVFDNLFIIPEITAVSPEDLTDEWTEYMLTPDGRLDIKTATFNLRQPGAYGKQRLELNVRNLPFSFYKNKKTSKEK